VRDSGSDKSAAKQPGGDCAFPLRLIRLDCLYVDRVECLDKNRFAGRSSLDNCVAKSCADDYQAASFGLLKARAPVLNVPSVAKGDVTQFPRCICTYLAAIVAVCR
jgi:hypothetical protein